MESKGKRTTTIGGVMAAVAIAAVALWWGMSVYLDHRRVDTVSRRVLGWSGKLGRDNAVTGSSASWNYDSGFGGVTWKYKGTMRTSAGHDLTLKAVARSGASKVLERVEISGAGRTVSVPIDDVLQDRPVDLRALLPEAYR